AAGLCSVCRAIPWVELQPEDVARAATPHHRTRKALEASAQRCPMCRMVLKAALSSFRDTRGVRNGRGYWRQFDAVRLVDTNLTARDISYQKELGACMPVTATEFKGPNPGGRAVIAATGAPNPDGEHVEDKELKLEGLRIDDPPDDMPVCVFGNFWAEREKEVNQPNDVSHLRLVGVGARFAKSASLFDVYGVRPDQVKLCGSSIGLCTDDDTSFASFIPGRLRELHSDSDTAFRRVEKWISDCSSKHAFCGAPKLNPDLPRRVIDVTAYDRGVCLLETAGQRGRYVALSHCWGTSSRLMATRESIDDLKEGIATSFLPKTFQDAIKITRRLGLKYLWIDCLCIVQDDLADWDVEAANMAYIYRNAYVTVAAAASTDSYYGCFPKRAKDSYVSPGTRSLGYATPREASGERRYTMAFTYSTDGAKKPSSVHFLEDEWLPGSSFHTPQRTAIGSFGRRFDPIAGEPLSSRGWTLQERMLSPRIVHYAGDQLYYECETGMWSEDGFVFSDIYFSLQHLLRTQLIAREDHGIPRASGISFIVGRHTATSGRRWEGGWISLVETYSRMRLTVADDKLPAIAGVATVIATETGDSYFAGLWAAHIHEDLCWRVCCYNEYFDRDAKGMQTVPKRGARVGAATRPKDYRAPTWSWASLDAPIKY
ncbi:heterokaryon incompatibility protein-domain-containing protein, partial [Lasiosphaeria miniovina]